MKQVRRLVLGLGAIFCVPSLTDHGPLNILTKPKVSAPNLQGTCKRPQVLYQQCQRWFNYLLNPDFWPKRAQTVCLLWFTWTWLLICGS